MYVECRGERCKMVGCQIRCACKQNVIFFGKLHALGKGHDVAAENDHRYTCGEQSLQSVTALLITQTLEVFVLNLTDYLHGIVLEIFIISRQRKSRTVCCGACYSAMKIVVR